MATSTIKKITFPQELSTITLKSTNDFPVVMQELGNEDFKGIKVADSNGTTRYNLIFTNGGLKFQSFDAAGNTLKNVDIVPGV